MKVTTDGCLFGAWVAERLHQEKFPAAKLLDIGAGTGLLSLMIAQQHAHSIDAVEMDTGAAKQAAQNTSDAGRMAQVNVYAMDIMDHAGTYDVIVSNPPFYESDLQSPAAARALAHHGSGLTWEQLFSKVEALLNTTGTFYLLLPYQRAGELTTYLGRNGLFLHARTTVRATPAHAPTRIMIAGGKAAKPLAEDDIAIKEANGAYSARFSALLRDYYLYL